MNYKHLFTIAAILIGTLSSIAQEVKLDPAVRHGVLDNGMTYYIRHNEEPKERVSFYMAQKVGAMVENDSQDGLAHFLEHMAFNGTKNFNDQKFLSVLERYGMEFGRDINAYTAFDQTVYNLSNANSTDEGLVDTCLLVLHDWSNFISLHNDEIDKERGVIVEEWRTRNDAGRRILKQSLPFLFENSKYAKRDVMGDTALIKNFDYQTLKDYYHKWYRPDLQAVIIIGDVDVDKMEAKVKKLMGSIPKAVNPAKRVYNDVPDYDKKYAVLTDKELSRTTIKYMWKHDEYPIDKRDTYDYFKFNLTNRLMTGMFGARIREYMNATEKPSYTSAGMYYSEYVPAIYDYAIYQIILQPDNINKGIEDALSQLMRAKNQGFLQAELDRAKTKTLTSYESAVKSKDRTSNDSYATEYVTNFIENEPCPGIETEYEVVKKVLDEISIDDINGKLKEWMTDKNLAVSYEGADKSKAPSESEIWATYNKLDKADLEPYKEDNVATELLDASKIKAGTIVSESTIDNNTGGKIFTLSNGVKLYFKHTDYNKDQVRLSAYSKGGTSLYGVEDLPTISIGTGFIGSFGIGDFDATQLGKLLTGKIAGSSVTVSDLHENVSGSCSPKDFETMMQLVYMRFMHPRFDEKAFNSGMSRTIEHLKQQSNNPRKALQDSVAVYMSNHSPRTLLQKPETYNKINFGKIEKLYKERFSDADDFTFLILGNIDEEEVKTMAAKYIASLPSLPTSENFVDHKEGIAKGFTDVTIPLKMEIGKATPILFYQKETDFSLEKSLVAQIISSVLDYRYTETIREEEGAAYGVSVNASMSREPEGEFNLMVYFDTDQTRINDIKKIVKNEIANLIQNGPSKENLDKAIKQMKMNRDELKTNNAYWLSSLVSFAKYGEDINDPANFENILNNMTPQKIQKYAKELIPDANELDLTFMPQQ
ncbi:MAG: M16 family metallopeptidase [Bacteroidales bacterium]